MVVTNRGKDRHKDKEAHKIFMRDYMRKRLMYRDSSLPAQ